MMLCEMNEPIPIVLFSKMAVLLILHPAPITQLAPIVTLGPITHPFPILAQGSIITHPMTVKCAVSSRLTSEL